MGEPRFERERGDGAAVGGDLTVGVDRAKTGQAGAGFGDGRSRRRVEPGKPGRIGLAPQQAGQHRAGQIGVEDFRRVVRGQSGVGGVFPQADRNAGRLASGATGALGRGGAAGALRDQAGEPGAAIVARAAGEAAVDDDRYVGECQAGFGDRTGEDQLAAAGRGRSKRGALGGRVDAAVKLMEDDVGGKLAQ